MVKMKCFSLFFSLKFETVKHNYEVKTIGSKYGQWSFINRNDLSNCTLVSCGLGEDASFDIEFANLYQANIIFVDPTPRAIQHFNEIVKNLGLAKKQGYSHNGSENVSSYNLESINSSQVTLVDKAMWTNTTKVKFFLPKDLNHISHSITNFQNNYSTETKFIYVDTITLESLMEEFKLSEISILKLDIEGAETFVINDMLEKGIFPNQICLEFDEMQKLSSKAKETILECHNNLLKYNYFLVHKKRQNFLYVHNDK